MAYEERARQRAADPVVHARRDMDNTRINGGLHARGVRARGSGDGAGSRKSSVRVSKPTSVPKWMEMLPGNVRGGRRVGYGYGSAQ